MTESLVDLMESNEANLEQIAVDFEKAVKLLNEALADKAFKKYNSEKNAFEGGFSISMYESILIGLSENIDKWEDENKLINLIKQIPYNSRFENATTRGKRAITRFKELTLLSKDLFKDEN